MNCRETRHSSTDCPLRYGNVQHCGTNEHNGMVSVDFKIPCQFSLSREIKNVFLGYLVLPQEFEQMVTVIHEYTECVLLRNDGLVRSLL